MNVLWSENLHFCKKQIHHQGGLTLNWNFWPKYQSIIHNIADIETTSSLKKAILWINNFLEVKNILIMDLFIKKTQRLLLYKMLIDGREFVWITCGSLRCIYQLFGLSFRWHPFTADDSWCWVKFLQICSDEQMNTWSSWMIWFSFLWELFL